VSGISDQDPEAGSSQGDQMSLFLKKLAQSVAQQTV
jgi:hypothetical protein